MNGLEIVMDIETLEIFEVIDHDGKDDEIVEFQSSDFSDKRDFMDSYRQTGLPVCSRI